MIQPGQFPITLYRNQVNTLDIEIEAALTGATYEFTLRRTKAAGGAALLALTNATAGSEGCSAVVDMAPVPPVTTLTIQIDEATLDAILPALSNGLPTGSDVVLAYDLHINGTRWLEGSATISEGVTY